MSTTIRLAGRSIHIVHEMADCDGCENHAAHARLEARSFLQDEINSGVYGDAAALADVRDLASTYGFVRDVHRVVDWEVLAQVGWLLRTERLIAVECRAPAQTAATAAIDAPPKPSARPRLRPTVVDEPPKSWVAIELLDDAGKPVANERYVVTVPEGVVKSGKLDDKGRARIADIDPGTCKISFPDLHGKEWH